MAVCKLYADLSPNEKNIFAGELFHSVISNDELFADAMLIITKAYEKGLFDRVKILPEDANGDNSCEMQHEG